MTKPIPERTEPPGVAPTSESATNAGEEIGPLSAVAVELLRLEAMHHRCGLSSEEEPRWMRLTGALKAHLKTRAGETDDTPSRNLRLTTHVPVILRMQGHQAEGTLRNISHGGVCIVLDDDRFAPGVPFVFQRARVTTSTAHIGAQYTVVWRCRDEETGSFVIGAIQRLGDPASNEHLFRTVYYPAYLNLLEQLAKAAN